MVSACFSSSMVCAIIFEFRKVREKPRWLFIGVQTETGLVNQGIMTARGVDENKGLHCDQCVLVWSGFSMERAAPYCTSGITLALCSRSPEEHIPGWNDVRWPRFGHDYTVILYYFLSSLNCFVAFHVLLFRFGFGFGFATFHIRRRRR